MAELSWQTIKEMVRDRAKGRCEYCLTAEINMGQALHIEHIRPEGGETLDNLCLACPNCNLSKAAAVTAVDPHTNTEVSLFNPREQQWTDHFSWTENFSHISGITPVRRAIVLRLKMNRPRIVLARQRWVQAGLHPLEE